MQPDPLTSQETDQPGQSTQPEILEPKSTLAQGKKPSRWNIAAIVLGVFMFIFLVAAAGLGYWAYALNGELVSTQQQLTALQKQHVKLQGDYAKLTSDNEKLNADLTQTKADLTQTKADLDKANNDLSSTQNDLKTSQDQNKTLHAKIDKISPLVEILYTSTTSQSNSDIFKIDALVNSTNDNQLIAKWNKFADTPSANGYADILLYLVTELHNDLK